MKASQVRTGRVAGALPLDVDRSIRDPGRVLVRILGLVLPVVVILAVGLSPSWRDRLGRIVLWLAAYLGFVAFLEVMRRLWNRRYETGLFQAARVAATLALISWLMAVSADAGLALWPFYLMPILAAILYFKRYSGTVVTILGAAAGLYVGGVVLAANSAFSTAQFVAAALTLGLLGFLVHRLFQRSLLSGQMLKIASDLRQTADLHRLLDQVIQYSQSLTGANRALVIVLDPGTGRFLAWAKRGFVWQTGRSVQDLVSACRVLRKGEPYRSGDLVAEFGDQSFYAQFFQCDPRSIMAEPLFDRSGRLLGTVSVTHDLRNRFDRRTMELYELFCQMAASALESYLYLRKERLADAAQGAVRNSLTQARDEETLAHALLGECQESFPHAVAAVLHAYDPETQELTPWLASHMEVDELGKSLMAMGVGVAGHALDILEPVVVPDVSEYPWFLETAQVSGFRSMMSAPLFDKETGQCLGTLSINGGEVGAFGSADEVKLAALCHQASILLLKIGAVSDAVQHTSLLEKILGAVLQLDTTLDDQELFAKIVQLARQALGFRECRLLLSDPESEDWIVVAAAGVSEQDATGLQRHRVPAVELQPLFAERFREGHSLFIPQSDAVWGVIDMGHLYPADSETPRTGRNLGNAVLAELEPRPGEISGLLMLSMPGPVRRPSPQAMDAIGVYALAAAWAIERARAHHRLKVQQDRMNAFLKSVSEGLASSRDLDAIGDVVVRAGADLIGAEGCSLYLVHEGKIELAYSSHLAGTEYMGRKKRISVAPGCGLVSWVAATGQGIRFRGLEYKDHPAWAGEEDHFEYLESGACRSLMYVPIINSRKGTIGVLHLENKTGERRDRGFDDADEEKLSFLAEQVDYAIEKVSRFKVVEGWERYGLEDDIHELINWYHSGVVLFLESAQEWFEKGDDRRAREMLPGVIERAYATLSELKTIHTAVIGRYWEADSIEVALHSMASAWGRRTGRLVDTDINVDLEGELPAREEGLLLRICTNAIGNSLMHSRVHELPDGRIWINLRLHQDQIELEVGDNGEGIHPSKGEGYGIMRMRQLATQLKTELELSSAPLAGTVIRVRAGLDREDR